MQSIWEKCMATCIVSLCTEATCKWHACMQRMQHMHFLNLISLKHILIPLWGAATSYRPKSCRLLITQLLGVTCLAHGGFRQLFFIHTHTETHNLQSKSFLFNLKFLFHLIFSSRRSKLSQLHIRVHRWCVWSSKAVRIRFEQFWNMLPILHPFRWSYVMVPDVQLISSHLFTSKILLANYLIPTHSVRFIITTQAHRSPFKHSSIFAYIFIWPTTFWWHLAHENQCISIQSFMCMLTWYFAGMHRTVKNKRCSNRCVTISWVPFKKRLKLALTRRSVYIKSCSNARATRTW